MVTRYSKILPPRTPRNFPGDVGGEIPAQWDRAIEIAATRKMFDKNYTGENRIISIDLQLAFENVVSVTAFIANIEDFPQFNTVYREYFPVDPPARATVQVAALNVGAQVELQMIAVR